MNDNRFLEKINTARRASLIYSQLIGWLDLSERSRQQLIKEGLTDEQITKLQIRDVPSEVCNFVLCSDLRKKIGSLDDVDGFVRTEFGGWKLDLSIKHGFLIPERSADGFIRCFRIFRSVRDERSFRLRSRNQIREVSL